jgi:DNA helicase IV
MADANEESDSNEDLRELYIAVGRAAENRYV